MWKIDFTQKEVDSYIAEIKQAEKLPDLFYELYNLDTDNSLEYGSLKCVTKSLFYIKTVKPASVWIAKKKYIPKKINRLSPKIFKIELSLATKIDNETSSNEQLNFMLKEAYFVNEQIGVKSAAKFYFNKELIELNETEIASLIVMIRNPALYNPKKRPEKLKLEVEKLLKKLPCSAKCSYENRRKNIQTLRFFNFKNPQINLHPNHAISTKNTILAFQTTN